MRQRIEPPRATGTGKGRSQHKTPRTQAGQKGFHSSRFLALLCASLWRIGALAVLEGVRVPCQWFRRRLMWKLALSHFITVFIAIAVVLVLNLAVVSGHLAIPGINIGKQIGEESIGRQAQAFALALSSEDAAQPALLSNQFRRFVTVAYVGNSSLATGHILVVDKQGILIDQVNSQLPIGAPVNDPEAPEMAQLVQNALAGETNLSSEKLYAFHASTGVYVGAYPIMDGANHPVGAILLRTARQEPFLRLLVGSLPNLLGTSPMAGLLVWVPVIVIALVVSVLLSRTLTRRLRRLQRAAGEIAAGNLDQHVPVTSIDEVGQLAAQFNRMAAQVREAIEKQRAFVANASHDLRTPIAVVQGHLDGLLSHRDAHRFDADTVRALTTMERQARQPQSVGGRSARRRDVGRSGAAPPAWSRCPSRRSSRRSSIRSGTSRARSEKSP